MIRVDIQQKLLDVKRLGLKPPLDSWVSGSLPSAAEFDTLGQFLKVQSAEILVVTNDDWVRWEQ